MTGKGRWRVHPGTKIGATALLVLAAETMIDGSVPGAVLGAFAIGWLAVSLALRRAVVATPLGRIAAAAATGFALILVDDPSALAVLMFGVASTMAALSPRHRFDQAFRWGIRLGRHAVGTLIAPFRDLRLAAAIRRRRGGRPATMQRVIGFLALPVAGTGTFLTLFAQANPLVARAFSSIVLPDLSTVIWRGMLAAIVAAIVWSSFRPSPWAIYRRDTGDQRLLVAETPGTAMLATSLVIFNATFAVENGLDIAFLWSGAALPAGVTMADYAHRGAYSLIVTALLAGLFVAGLLRPGSAAAASPMIRRLVTLWIAQNLLLVASSALRTLDYVDAYGMTVLRLAALMWMVLVAVGLALIGWRLLTGRSDAWLINATALAAALALALASAIDLGAAAAAWNADVALAKGRAGPPLDLCYIRRLGTSALIPLAALERRAADPVLHDRLAFLRWQAQSTTAEGQRNWRRWTWRNARRLAAAEALVGSRAPDLRRAPYGPRCDGTIAPPARLTAVGQP